MSQTASHPASAEKHGDGAFDSSTEALGLLESRSLLGGYACWSFLAASLRNARRGNTGVKADLLIGRIVKAAIRGIGFRSGAEHAPVVVQRRGNMFFIGGVPLQDAILRDQTMRTLSEEDFMTEFDRLIGFAALDQIRMGFEDGVDLVGGGNLLSVDDTSASLIDRKSVV